MRQKIIIDTDPGQDDAVAILLALASPELEVLGLTCVAGNVGLGLTQRNARLVVGLSGSDVAVYAGCDAPLSRKLVTAEAVHGKTGLDGIDLGSPSVPLQSQHGVAFIVETLRREPSRTVTLVAIGPLTNIATAFAAAPDIVARVRQVVLMGGARRQGGNITPAAEFNIYVDPEAAAAVFASGADLVVMPLDVTHLALTSDEWIAGMAAMGNRAGQAVASWTASRERFDPERYGANGAPLHDPCTIAWLLGPQMFSGRHVNVQVETSGEFTAGMTVVDWWGVTGRAPNALFIDKLDREGVFGLLTERIGRLS